VLRLVEAFSSRLEQKKFFEIFHPSVSKWADVLNLRWAGVHPLVSKWADVLNLRWAGVPLVKLGHLNKL
jgi:hypothetical protein